MTRSIRRTSKQRAAVIAAVRSSAGHPAADEIYARARAAIPNISLGTVYRNLRLLVEEGAIGEAPVAPGEAARFDKTTAAHDHFICTRCHAIFDVPATGSAQRAARVERCTGASVFSQRLDFYGLCANCRTTTARSHVPPRRRTP